MSLNSLLSEIVQPESTYSTFLLRDSFPAFFSLVFSVESFQIYLNTSTGLYPLQTSWTTQVRLRPFLQDWLWVCFAVLISLWRFSCVVCLFGHHYVGRSSDCSSVPSNDQFYPFEFYVRSLNFLPDFVQLSGTFDHQLLHQFVATGHLHSAVCSSTGFWN